jgi:hypothetical protein
MADLSVTPVATGIKPQPTMSLADMLNMARGFQAYQQAQQINPLEVQRAQMELSRLQQLTPEQVRQARAEAQVAAETAQPRISTAGSQATSAAAQARTAGAQATTAELGAEQAGVDLSQHYANISRGVYGGLLTDPDFVKRNSAAMEKKLKQAEKFLRESGVPTHKSNMHDQLLDLAKTDPDAAYQMIANGIQQGGGVGNQFAQANVAPTAISTGAGTQLIPVNPYQGARQGLFVPNQLPPTTLVVNPETGQTTYLGATGPAIGQPGAPQQPVVAGMGPGQSAAVTGAGNVVAGDWAQTYQAGQQAGPRIATFQNIKRLVPEAFTGVGGERKQFLSGLAQSVGIPVAELESSTTDELAKNTKILQLAGGNTDAARAIAELANPNLKMTKEGIFRVTDQLIGIEKMNQARANFLQPASANAAQYAARANEFNQIADPRLFQEMSREEVRKVKAAMTDKERAELYAKIQRARQLGIIR